MKTNPPTDSSFRSKSRGAVAWALFLAGLVIPFWTFCLDNILHPEGNLLPGQSLWWLPLALLCGLIATMAAPFFLTLPVAGRAALALSAPFAFVSATYVASIVFTWPSPSFANRKAEARVRQIVATIGAPTLSADAARLARELPKGGHLVDPSVWPASFKAFTPKDVRRFDDSFLIVISQWVSHFVGVLIEPPDYPEPEPDKYILNIKIAPGIYFHSS